MGGVDLMAKTYVRVTKLSDAGGRSDYISNPEKQDHIFNHEKSGEFDWQEYADFELKNQKSKEKNNEARELVIALPNEISELPAEKRSEISHDLAIEILGDDRDYEFALHFNKAENNFHMHLIFSERERSKTAEIKRYKRDMWYDKETNRMAKKNAPGAELRYQKGQPMKDKDGNIRYTDEPFTVKDKKFATKAWLHGTHKTVQEVLLRHGYKLDIYDPEKEVKQQKLYKGADAEYLEFAKAWNESAKQINQETKEELGDMEFDRDSLQQKLDSFDRQELMKLRKNKIPKSITDLSKKRRLEAERKAIVDERDALIDKYQFDLDKKKTHPETVISKLNKRILSVYDKFKAKKQDLINRLVTIKDHFVVESPKITSKDFSEVDKGITPQMDLKGENEVLGHEFEQMEGQRAPKKKEGVLERMDRIEKEQAKAREMPAKNSPKVYWYDVDWSDDYTRYNISNASPVAFGDEYGLGNATALAFELTDDEIEDFKVTPIPPLRKLTADELIALELQHKRAMEIDNDNHFHDFGIDDDFEL